MTEKNMRATSHVAETEALMEQTIIRVADIHERMTLLEANINKIPDLQKMVEAMSLAQSVIAKSAESMSETYRKFEERQERTELRHEELIDALAGKEQIPLKSHYWTLFAALLPTVVMFLGISVGILYVSKYDIKASLTAIELNQHKTQSLIESTKDAVKKVEEQTVK